jgi:hypothetical protein
MAKTFGFLAGALAAVALQNTAAAQERPCVEACFGPLPIVSCAASSVVNPKSSRIGIVGRILSTRTLRPSCGTILSIEVIRASVEKMPSRIDVDINCVNLAGRPGDIINFIVFALADPTTGVYKPSACPL